MLHRLINDFWKTQVEESILAIYDDSISGLERTGQIDSDPENNRELYVEWNFDVDRALIREYHVYVRINDADRFVYLGRSPSANNPFLRWRAENSLISAGFRNGPQFNNRYAFIIYPKFGS